MSTALKGISDRVNTDHVVLWQQGSCGFLHMCHVPGLWEGASVMDMACWNLTEEKALIVALEGHLGS